LQGKRFDNTATVRLMQMLARGDGQDYLDYSSAQQIAGALDSLAKEAQFSDAKRTEIAKVIGELKSSLGFDLKNKWQAAASYDPQRFKNQLSRLAQFLM